MIELPEIVRSPSLAEMAKQRIQEAIWSGQLVPGAHLVETTLADGFQISRGPLREALRTLAAEGLVEYRPGRGAFVIDPTLDQMQDMIVLRAVLGGMAARYAAQKQDAALFDELAASLKRMRAAADRDDEKAFFDEHWHFYEVMHAAANEFIFRSWKSLYGLNNIYVRRLGRPFLTLNTILQSHDCFFRMMQAGDPDEAEAVVRSQMLLVGFLVLDRPLPKMLHAYATRRIGEDGAVIRLDPDRIDDRGRAQKNKLEDTRDHAGASPDPGRA